MREDPVVLAGTVKRYGAETQGRVKLLLPVPLVGRVEAYVLPEYVGKQASYLLHLGMTAHLRWVLGIPKERWRYPESVGEVVPDAEAVLEDGVYAVEVDVGYSRLKMRRKVQAYRLRYDGQLWGVTSPARERDVRAFGWPKPVRVVRFSLEEVAG